MRTDAAMQLADAVEAAKLDEDLMIRCPSHDDGTASLHVNRSGNSVLLHCHAGCETRRIIDAVNLPWSTLFIGDPESITPADEWTPAGPASNVYPYRDENGNLLFEVLRVAQGKRKTFFQRRPVPTDPGRYIWKLDDTRRVLYRLPQIIEAIRSGRTIYVTEGEKDADTLVSLGLDATCNPAGAGKWREDYTAFLAGATVVVLADADSVGRAHARTVRDQLVAAGCRVEVREAVAPHKDVSDMIAAGGQLDSLMVTIPFDDEKRVKFGVDFLDIVIREHSDTRYVMPGVLARRERLLLTGFEGHGKTTLMHQMAAQAAAGIHWFRDVRVPRQRCLVIDAENEPDQRLDDWLNFNELSKAYGDDNGIERGQLIVLEEWDNSELDLSDPDGTAWLHERIHGYQPDIVFMGPLTNLVGRDLRDDEPVRRLKQAVNSARTICGSAFVMEHHAPHRNPSDKQRSVRPYGSSMFLKWPDYGFGLQPVVDQEGTYLWQRTRWPRVRSRGWPAALRWGSEGEWPWMETRPPE